MVPDFPVRTNNNHQGLQVISNICAKNELLISLLLKLRYLPGIKVGLLDRQIDTNIFPKQISQTLFAGGIKNVALKIMKDT